MSLHFTIDKFDYMVLRRNLGIKIPKTHKYIFRIRKGRVLIYGTDSNLLLEVAKNVILNGVGEIVLALKVTETKIFDTDFLKSMNPQVNFKVLLCADDFHLNFFKSFDYVVLLNLVETEMVLQLSSFCRTNCISLSWAVSFGTVSFFINDWGNHVSEYEVKYTI